MRDRHEIEHQLANLALCDPNVHETIQPGTRFDQAIENRVCRAIVETCALGRAEGIDRGMTDHEWMRSVICACSMAGLASQRVAAYLRYSYRAPADSVYLTTADAWAALMEVGE